jgi:hypothetical protein
MRARAAAAVLTLLVACGKDKADSVRDSVTSTPAATTTGTNGVPTDCPRTGHWTPCQLKKRLEQAGLAPRDTNGLADLPTLATKPAEMMLGNAGFAYYLFADSLARHQAAATLDTTRYIPQSTSLTMRNEATRIESDNLLAILLSRNEHQRERVSDAVTAGPPQP